MSTQQVPPKSTDSTFSDRIRLLIQHVGSVTQIARTCGFSEGVVRSWRDGSTDPSRARCVTLAHTFNISLEWLVAGEGQIQINPATNSQDKDYNIEAVSSQQPHSELGWFTTQSSLVANEVGLDTQRLNTALQLLQSELDLADSPLKLADRTDLLSELYEILGPRGASVDAAAMMAFNLRLTQILRTR
ncbi:MAG: helix-turn-helix transcriptional regulator [Rhodanobacter sp.]